MIVRPRLRPFVAPLAQGFRHHLRVARHVQQHRLVRQIHLAQEHLLFQRRHLLRLRTRHPPRIVLARLLLPDDKRLNRVHIEVAHLLAPLHRARVDVPLERELLVPVGRRVPKVVLKRYPVHIRLARIHGPVAAAALGQRRMRNAQPADEHIQRHQAHRLVELHLAQHVVEPL